MLLLVGTRILLTAFRYVFDCLFLAWYIFDCFSVSLWLHMQTYHNQAQTGIFLIATVAFLGASINLLSRGDRLWSGRHSNASNFHKGYLHKLPRLAFFVRLRKLAPFGKQVRVSGSC